MISEKTYYYPNRMGRILFLAMEEILGRSGVNAVLNLADLQTFINNYPPYNQDLGFSFGNISQLQIGLESAYGPRTARGLALRVGRASFKYGLREFGPELGLTDLAFRLLPLPAKLKKGSEAFAALFNKFTDQRVRLERDEKFIYWHIERCPICWERRPKGNGASFRSSGPCCHLAVGLLQEALYWLSSGRYFEVEEEKCIACGDSTCTILINQTPMS
jgi:predicted hydrocarbon binding protein